MDLNVTAILLSLVTGSVFFLNRCYNNMKIHFYNNVKMLPLAFFYHPTEVTKVT